MSTASTIEDINEKENRKDQFNELYRAMQKVNDLATNLELSGFSLMLHGADFRELKQAFGDDVIFSALWIEDNNKSTGTAKFNSLPGVTIFD